MIFGAIFGAVAGGRIHPKVLEVTFRVRDAGYVIPLWIPLVGRRAAQDHPAKTPGSPSSESDSKSSAATRTSTPSRKVIRSGDIEFEVAIRVKHRD